MIAFTIDIQTVVPRIWTLIGQVMFTVGTIFLIQPNKCANVMDSNVCRNHRNAGSDGKRNANYDPAGSLQLKLRDLVK